jgi:hypothetical protein
MKLADILRWQDARCRPATASSGGTASLTPKDTGVERR